MDKESQGSRAKLCEELQRGHSVMALNQSDTDPTQSLLAPDNSNVSSAIYKSQKSDSGESATMLSYAYSS
jgi:hypothetical protein